MSIRLLVVDDEPMIRSVIKRILKGCDVDAVATGAEAMALHRSRPYPFALIDINLGDCSGPVLAVRLMQVAPIHVVLSSGADCPSSWDGDYLRKPFGMTDIVGLLDRIDPDWLR
jgi:DNA-binding response OmpR family regulator